MATALVSPDLLYASKGPSLLIVNTRGECAPDQGTIAFGLRRFGFEARVHDLARALFDLARCHVSIRPNSRIAVSAICSTGSGSATSATV